MRVVTLPSYGPPEALEIIEVDRPEPADGEVLVRVEAIGLNPVDAAVRSGAFPIGGPPPMVLGWDLAGTVEATGAGVDRFTVGDRVFGLPRFPQPARTYAEYVVAPAAELAPAPAGLDAVHAAALPLAGLTCWQSLVGAADLQPGQHVLILAAGGGVGHLAVQIAKARGARVTATTSPGKAAFVKGLGADTVLDYLAGDLSEQTGEVDVLLDTVGGELTEQCVPLVRPGGTLVSLLRHTNEADVQATVEAAGRRFAAVLVTPDADGLIELTRLVDAGALRVHVERVYRLEELPEAHRRLEGSAGRGSGTGIMGKLVAVP
jgi:NADPH:quinone reductase-like Zn-dependent oxidoreductase